MILLQCPILYFRKALGCMCGRQLIIHASLVVKRLLAAHQDGKFQRVRSCRSSSTRRRALPRRAAAASGRRRRSCRPPSSRCDITCGPAPRWGLNICVPAAASLVVPSSTAVATACIPSQTQMDALVCALMEDAGRRHTRCISGYLYIHISVFRVAGHGGQGGAEGGGRCADGGKGGVRGGGRAAAGAGGRAHPGAGRATGWGPWLLS
jgi:hypothetical protein